MSAGRRGHALLDRHERRDRLALDLVRLADDRGLGHLRMIDQRALDFHRAEPMSGHVQHVVDAPEQPVVAVAVEARAVAREVDAVRPLAPVLLLEALRIAVDAAQHARPRLRERQQAAAFLNALAAAVRISGVMPGNGFVADPGFERRDARQRRDQDVSRLRLPPRVDDRTPAAADVFVVPHPRFGVDRLADRSEQAQSCSGRGCAGHSVPHFMNARIAVGAV